MLVRLTTGKSGIAEYLENGQKSDRSMTRDEIDLRECIDGDLDITRTIIDSMNATGRDNNYYHITLSFSEKDISKEKIEEVYEDYKSLLLNAYDSDEFNSYAEIHFPKVKSYIDKSTGEKVERFPHVHMVIPKVNLETGKDLNPIGNYKSNQKYFESIQEKLNYKHGLSSPFDNQRQKKVSKSDLISRYKGDQFKGAGKDLKDKVFSEIRNGNIKNFEGLRRRLLKEGEVRIVNTKSEGEYLKVRPKGNKKFVRLTDQVFRKNFLDNGILEKEKPSEKKSAENVSRWMKFKSYEIKHIHSASPKERNEYRKLSITEKEEYLHVRRNEPVRRKDRSTERKHTTKIRWADSRKLGVNRARGRSFAEIPNGLPSMSEHNVDVARRRRGNDSPKLLHDHASNSMDAIKTSRNYKLRRFVSESGRGLIEKDNENINKPKSVAEQIKYNHDQSRKKENEEVTFSKIKKSIDANRLLKKLEYKNGISASDYTVWKKRGGENRIKVGNLNLNVSDFCTKHIGLSWDETKDVLKEVYKEQINDLNHKKVVQKENNAINRIIFKSNKALRTWDVKSSNVAQSISALKSTQNEELRRNSMSDLEIKNSSNTHSLEEAAERVLKARAAVRNLDISMNDVVATKDAKKDTVAFSDKRTGEEMFKDKGTSIVMTKREPTANDTAAALTYAAEKYGTVEITGTKAFKESVVAIAAQKNLNIVFSDKDLQQKFVQSKSDNVEVTKAAQNLPSQPTADKGREVKIDYNFNESSSKYEVKINGQAPGEVSKELLSTAIANDRFLKMYSVEEITSNALDPKKAKGEQPVPKTIAQDGSIHSTDMSAQSDSKKNASKM
ncbi:LPD7 domain-containing protein [Grimontia sp. SpTr1]|uniref:LPD7 domain-containing protein n=1 Tax=Grimontia sp. SpTr1 TaxID=2995319 RepID=UPI00248AEE42|nr:LPD7 domain-containing protein [Grimontia sp. SpTr1]